MYQWAPYVPRDVLFCVVEASCCEEYILCSELAEFFVVRRIGRGRYEETSRGSYASASAAWIKLSEGHQHKSGQPRDISEFRSQLDLGHRNGVELRPNDGSHKSAHLS